MLFRYGLYSERTARQKRSKPMLHDHEFGRIHNKICVTLSKMKISSKGAVVINKESCIDQL